MLLVSYYYTIRTREQKTVGGFEHFVGPSGRWKLVGGEIR